MNDFYVGIGINGWKTKPGKMIFQKPLGINKLRDISNSEDCEYVLWNGSKRMFKRRKLDAYLEAAYSI